MSKLPEIKVEINKDDRCIEAKVKMPTSLSMAKTVGYIGWSVCISYDTGIRQPSKLLAPTVEFLKNNKLDYLLPSFLLNGCVTLNVEVKLSQLPELEAALTDAAMKKLKEINAQ